MVTFDFGWLATVAVRSDQFTRFCWLGFWDAVAVASPHADVVVDGHRFVAW